MMNKIKDKLYTFYHDKKTERLKKFPPKVVENRILFETENDFDGNARLLYDYMIKNGYNRKYELIWLVNHPEKYKKYVKDNVKFVRKFRKDCEERRADCYEAMLSSKYIFYNESVNWIAQTQKRQVFINLWEGCDYKISSRRHKIFFDYCLIRSDAFTQSIKKYFGCTSKKLVLLLGNPVWI